MKHYDVLPSEIKEGKCRTIVIIDPNRKGKDNYAGLVFKKPDSEDVYYHNEQLLQEAERFNGLVFYFYANSSNIPAILKNVTYNLVIKHTVNRFNEKDYDSYNYLPYNAASDFYQYYWDKGCSDIKCKFSGNWPQEEKDRITLGRLGH